MAKKSKSVAPDVTPEEVAEEIDAPEESGVVDEDREALVDELFANEEPEPAAEVTEEPVAVEPPADPPKRAPVNPGGKFVGKTRPVAE